MPSPKKASSSKKPEVVIPTWAICHSLGGISDANA
jgi:hypothetical protein